MNRFINAISQWLGRDRVKLNAHQMQRLQAWQARPKPDALGVWSALRWVVVDVEASGLDLRQNRLISIGAVAVHGAIISLGDCFEVVLQQEDVSPTANILVHGIGGMAQRMGEPPVEAMLGFLDYVGTSPLVAFHAAFDATMIDRAMRRYLGVAFKRPMLDLAYLAPALFPRDAAQRRALDDWLQPFNIRNLARHNAVADAMATAELLQVALAQAHTQGLQTLHQLREVEHAQRELSRMNSSAF